MDIHAQIAALLAKLPDLERAVVETDDSEALFVLRNSESSDCPNAAP